MIQTNLDYHAGVIQLASISATVFNYQSGKLLKVTWWEHGLGMITWIMLQERFDTLKQR